MEAFIRRVDIEVSIEFNEMTITMKDLKSPNHSKGVRYDIVSSGYKGTYDVTGDAKKFILQSFVKTEAHEEALKILEEATK